MLSHSPLILLKLSRNATLTLAIELDVARRLVSKQRHTCKEYRYLRSNAENSLGLGFLHGMKSTSTKYKPCSLANEVRTTSPLKVLALKVDMDASVRTLTVVSPQQRPTFSCGGKPMLASIKAKTSHMERRSSPATSSRSSLIAFLLS